MCNNYFIKNETWPILQDKKWSCSWRYAGGIIADMLESGDYVNWYCSGIRNDDVLSTESFNALSIDEQEKYLKYSSFLPEATVTDEVRKDLLKLGWVVKTDDDQML